MMFLKLYQRNVFSIVNTASHQRFMSSKIKEAIVVTDNSSTVVCWHPKPEFPYECTKPIPVEPSKETDSVLKLTWNSDLKQLFKKKHPDIARQELMEITYTTKHRWYPRSRDKRAKKTPMDREYL